MTLQVGILLFDQVEVLDFAGPYEVFTTATRIQRRTNPALADAFKVVTIAQKQVVVARAGMQTLSDYHLADAPALSLLIIPGGDITQAQNNKPLIDWIKNRSLHTPIVASVCTGAFLLAQANILNGLTVTTHWEDAADLQQQFPQIHVDAQQRWIDKGQVITSAGISAGLDMCLHLVARLTNEELAIKTARQLDYAPQV